MREIETERVVTRAEAAEYLRQFADKLAGDGDHTGSHADDHTTSGDHAGAATSGGTTRGTTQQSPGRPSDASESTTVETREEAAGPADETTTTAQEGTADAGRSYGKVTFLVGNDSATVNPPEEVTLNVEVGEDSSMMSSGAETVTFSLHWDKDTVPESDELRIE